MKLLYWNPGYNKPSKQFFDHFEHSYNIWDKWFDLDFAATTTISDQKGDYLIKVPKYLKYTYSEAKLIFKIRLV